MVRIKSGEIKNDGEKSEEKMIRIGVWLKRENISDFVGEKKFSFWPTKKQSLQTEKKIGKKRGTKSLNKNVLLTTFLCWLVLFIFVIFPFLFLSNSSSVLHFYHISLFFSFSFLILFILFSFFFFRRFVFFLSILDYWVHLLLF